MRRSRLERKQKVKSRTGIFSDSGMMPRFVADTSMCFPSLWRKKGFSLDCPLGFSVKICH